MKTSERDEKVVLDIVDELINTFVKKVPPDVMSTPRGQAVMYNATVHLLKRICDQCNISKDTVKNHLDAVWASSENIMPN